MLFDCDNTKKVCFFADQTIEFAVAFGVVVQVRLVKELLGALITLEVNHFEMLAHITIDLVRLYVCATT